jgi:methylmalonyl-CoA/ethylmalonyl-CoA epimerase
MKLGRLNHIGVATPSIADSIVFYRDVMGATKIHEPFDLPDQGVKVCFVDTPSDSSGGADGALNGTQIELIEPLPGNASISSFLEKNPAGGQHHLCYEVPDIHAAKAWFKGQGKRVLGEPRIGAHGTLIFFVHPKDMQGVLTEIMETPPENHKEAH